MIIIPIMISDMGKSDEVVTTETCIIGAGPHGLAAALYLKQADPFADLTVIDRSNEWLANWTQQFKRAEIATLRSPIVHHPAPNPYALTDFVTRKNFSRSDLPYDPPTTQAFSAFCAEIITEADLAPPLIAAPKSVRSDHNSIKLETSSGIIYAQNLITAMNPHQRIIPQWTWNIIGHQAGLIEHAFDVDLPNMPDLYGQRVVIIGGGLTGAHLARNATQRGASVTIVARRPLQIRDFDTEPGWLGPKYLNDYHADSDATRRIQTAHDARNGSSIPGWMLNSLTEPINGLSIEILDSTEVLSAQPTPPKGCVLNLTTEEEIYCDQVWLATGTQSSLHSMRWLQPILQDIPTIDGLPLVDQSLRLGPHPIFVMGRSATFALGPAAGNLWGARQAAHRITTAITGLELGSDGSAHSSKPRNINS